MSSCSLPDKLSLELIASKYLIQHDLDIMRSVPVAVEIKRPGFLKHPVQFNASRPHKLDIRLRRGVPVFKRPFFLRLAPEHLIIAVAVKRRVDIDQIHAPIRQLLQLLQVIPAIYHPCIHHRRRPPRMNRLRRSLPLARLACLTRRFRPGHLVFPYRIKVSRTINLHPALFPYSTYPQQPPLSHKNPHISNPILLI